MAIGKEEKVAASKLLIVQYGILAIFLVLLFGLWRLQISGSDKYESLAEQNRIRTFPILGRILPVGWISSEFNITTGITGAPLSSASRATPVLPRYSRPSGERVPSG